MSGDIELADLGEGQSGGEAGPSRGVRELEAVYAQRCGVAEIAALIDEVVGERAVTS